MVKYSYVTAYIFGKTEAQQMEKALEKIIESVHRPMAWDQYNSTNVRNNTNCFSHAIGSTATSDRRVYRLGVISGKKDIHYTLDLTRKYHPDANVNNPLADLAEEKGVKLGIENCLMDGTWEHAACNIGFNPKAWEVMFEEVKNDNFGLEWEPTHQMVQLIDPVTELRKWCKKIVHIHGKDATIDWDAVRHSGISGAVPFVWHRMPGFGDTNWRDIISILRSNGYEDDICIEGYHDPVYNGELEMTGQLHALNYLKWCRGGEFTPTPWEK